MTRFEDSPNLFGAGFGDSTSRELICEYCGKVYNKGVDDDSNDEEGIDVPYTDFAGKQICYCCFEKIENEILIRIPEILKWYRKIVEARKKSVQVDEILLKGLSENE